MTEELAAEFKAAMDRRDKIRAGEIYTIELDCPPMAPRPDVYLPGVLEGTGLVVEDFKNTARVFGNWEYELVNLEKVELYKQQQSVIGERVKALYNRGAIRYGSW